MNPLLRARAKLLAAKEPLGQQVPFITSFLGPFPLQVSETPEVYPAYLSPKPECTFALQAVEVYALAELRVMLLHEAMHASGDVFGRCGDDRDWDDWVMADDLKNNTLIQGEINRLDRLGINGTNRATAILAWPHDMKNAVDFRFYGWTTEAIYDALQEMRAKGEDIPYPRHRDCPESFRGQSLETRKGAEYMRRVLYQAVQDAHDAGEEGGDLLEFAIRDVAPRLPWYSILDQAILGRMDHAERRTYLHPSPRDMDRDDGLVKAGYVPSGNSLAFAEDISLTTTHRGIKAANRFLEEAEGASRTYEGPIRHLLWDVTVKLDQLVSPGGMGLREALVGVRGGGGTRPECLLEHLRSNRWDASGLELPSPDFLVILTDGLVQQWPAVEDWPCEVLVVYTKKAPPLGYHSIYLEVA
jgi:hypothetical protein